MRVKEYFLLLTGFLVGTLLMYNFFRPDLNAILSRFEHITSQGEKDSQFGGMDIIPDDFSDDDDDVLGRRNDQNLEQPLDSDEDILFTADEEYFDTSDDNLDLDGDDVNVLGDPDEENDVGIENSNERTLSFDDFKGLPQDNSQWIDYIRREVIVPPSQEPYKLKYPKKKHFSENGQSEVADDILFHGMRDGFFIEAGAIDGEYLSNSLYFERELGWTGLLVEPNSDIYKQLLAKGRKAYSVNGALSPVQTPSEIFFKRRGYAGKMTRFSKDKTGMTMKTFPLYSLLFALNVTTIDLFSLDVEGLEMKILHTLPWDKLKFKVLCIETILIPEGLNNMIKYVEEQGYKSIGTRRNDVWFVAPELWNVNLMLKLAESPVLKKEWDIL